MTATPAIRRSSLEYVIITPKFNVGGVKYDSLSANEGTKLIG